MANWGFPPEQDKDQRESFREAVQIFRQAGMRTFGYVQLSNCVYAGSYRERDRRLLDGANITQRVIQGGGQGNPLFAVPSAEDRAELLRALVDPLVPRVKAEQPVLITWLRRQGEVQQPRRDRSWAKETLHLVNYADRLQEVTVEVPWSVRALLSSPGLERQSLLEGRSLRVALDVYAGLACERR